MHIFKFLAKMILFTRKCGYVDFASGEELQKALQLNGSYLMGHPLILSKDKRGKEEHKKGNWLNMNFSRNYDSFFFA